MHVTEYYLVIKSNDVLVHDTPWKNLKDMPSEKKSITKD